MATYAINTVLWRFTLFQSLHGQECQNIFHFRNKEFLESDDHLIAQTQGLAGDFLFRISAAMLECQSTQVSWIRTVTVVVIPHNGPFHTQIIESANGFQPNDSLPSYAAGILTLNTPFSGRRNRGRLYIAGVPEDLSANSRMDPDLFTAYQSLGATLRSNFGPGVGSTAYEHVLYSHADGDDGLGHAGLAGVKRLSTIQAKANLVTQRHRLLGHGT
jgi:hypothetical protein